jgi:hypothetical protein
MKIIVLAALAAVVSLTGCASINDPAYVAAEPVARAYTPLGTLIPKKTMAPGEASAMDMQSFDNNRTMNNGSNSALGSSK